MGTTRAVWRNGGVRGVVLAFGAMSVGEWVLGTTVAIHAYSAGGAVLVGLIGFRFVPASLTSIASYRLVERFRRERILTAVSLVRVVCGLGVALSLWKGISWEVPVVLVWLDAAAGAAYRPAQAALLPALVNTPGELTTASALCSNARSVGQLLGALLGSLLVSFLAIGLAVGAAPVLYFVGFLATGGIRTPQLRSAVDQTRYLGVLARVRSGLSALFIDREATELTILSAMRSLVRGLWISLGVVAAETVLGLGKAGFGWLMAAAMGGAGLSLFVTAKLWRARALVPWFSAGLVLCGVPVACIGLFTNGGLAIGLMVVWGLGMALADAVGQVLLYRVVPAREIGRASGVMQSGKLLFTGAGSILAPAILAAFGIRGALVAAGAFVPIVLVLLVTIIRPSVLRRIQRRSERRANVIEPLLKVPAFAPLRLEAIEAVAAQLQPVEVPAGTAIVTHRQYDDGGWYLIRSGEVDVDIDGFVVNHLGPGESFGELALLRDMPRTATVRATTPVSLLKLDRRSFLEAIAGDEVDTVDVAEQEGPQRDLGDVLRRTPLLRDLADETLRHLVAVAAPRDYAAGETITSEGDHDDRFFVILSGTALAWGPTWSQDLSQGDGFGEIAALHGVARTATVSAKVPCRILVISGQALRAALATKPRPAATQQSHGAPSPEPPRSAAGDPDP